MEVTKENFNEALPLVKEAINKATFLAIDCELTGLIGRQDGINIFDTPKEYFEKCRNASRQYLIVQYGICCFRYDADGGNFKHQAFNFYTFQRPINRYIQDKTFSCQSSCIDFLIKEGFDFNKLFKEGISYLNLAEETKYREWLTDAQKNRAEGLQVTAGHNQPNIIGIPDNDKPFIKDVFKQIDEFLLTDKEEMVLPKCNSFVRRLIYQMWDSKGHDRYSLESRTLENKDRVIVVSRPKSLSKELDENKKKEEEELLEFDNAVGFSKVMKHVAESGKLIVGHNMLLDLLHTIDKFLMPLQQNYNEFKDCASTLFSKILDTKHLCTTPIFKDLVNSSVLPHLLETVQKEPFDSINIGIEENCCGYKLEDEKQHVAAYDAFITGYSLIALWKYLGNLEECPESKVFNDLQLLDPYMNKIHLMRLHDAQYINLAGDDPSPPRDHVFYLKFPKEWKTSDLVQLFSAFGGVHIGWIDSTSAYVGLYKRDNAGVAYSTLSQSNKCTILTYARRQAQLQGCSALPISPTNIRNRKSLEGLQPSSKKRRTNSFGENSARKRSIEPIKEFPELESRDNSTSVVPIEIKSNRKRTLSKTFEEDSCWD